MNPNNTDLKVDLISAEATIPIDIQRASKFSLLVKPLNGYKFKYSEEFSNLVVQTENDSFELGCCCILAEKNNGDHAGRLIFKNDIYDLECLVCHHKLVKIQDEFLNLSLILEQKDRISKDFKNFTSNLTYDLSVYKNIFDKLDADFSSETAAVKTSLQDALINSEKGRFFRFLDEKMQELEQIVKSFSKVEHKRHGFYFRTQLWNFIMSSPFMARTNLKPRGYAGDSEMMNMIYANDYRGESTFSKLMHKHPLEQPAAQAVRNRRHAIAKSIYQIIDNGRKSANRNLKILSVACGPSRELGDAILSAADCKNLHFALLDQDPTALLEARESVRQIEKKINTKIDVDFLNESVRTLLAMPQIDAKWGQFDFIYSMGLFDYLTPPAASLALVKLYKLLKHGGEMVIGNFHVSNPNRNYMEYWLDWVLYHRTEEEFTSLIKGVSDAEIKLFFEDSKVQMFLHVTKRI
jgi:extracellular factor (EF) 3-hydroxypalmitic acid methyl ester biosynthesis protein